ncbi:COP9 signalosome complex subunit 3 [Schistosoma bovis]|uniref:COP9 signalosome complex subunit 3 n=1 Tax=Schistosoma bovis TaxID=6184 RepID=A0A430QL93_SCHBO|nr:COP9 signalosome complex subunit 3 [Schistosoma bovis]
MVSGSLSNFSSAVNKTAGSANALCELVEKSQDFLIRNVHSLDFILDDFDIVKFGILHAAVIHAKYISQSVVDKEWLVIQTQNLFNLCNAESLQKVPSYVLLLYINSSLSNLQKQLLRHHFLKHFCLFQCYCQPYLELATAFRSNNPEDLTNFVDLHRELFTADFNFGLVKQVIKCHGKFRIQSLTKVDFYDTIPDRCCHAYKTFGNPRSGETDLRYGKYNFRITAAVINSKAIFANIDQQNGTVHFLDDPEQYDSIKMLRILQEKITECVNLEKHFMQLTDRLVTNPNYAKRVR